MKKIRNGLKSLLLLAACLTLLLGALPVHAELSDAQKEALTSNIEQFLSTAYKASDVDLEQMKANGGFYEVFYNSWTADREEVGEFKSVDDMQINEDDDDQIVVTSKISFEKYSADVLIYLDKATANPVNYEMNIDYSLSEKVVQGAQNMAVGLIVVFAVLVFLTLVIFLFRFINPELRAERARKQAEAQKMTEKTQAPAAAAQDSPAADKAAAAPAAGTVPTKAAPQAPAGDASEELVAVMAAAIAAAEADGMRDPRVIGIPAPVYYDHGDPSYQVRPLRRNSSRSWKRA